MMGVQHPSPNGVAEAHTHHGTRLIVPSILSRGAYDSTMRQIDCVCGYVVKGEDDDELWEQAQEHIRTDHPDLVGKVSREDILAQAEET
jgi:predicted small metal-binding protein